MTIPFSARADSVCQQPTTASETFSVGFARVFKGREGDEWAACDVRVGLVVPLKSFGPLGDFKTAGFYLAYVSEPDDFAANFDIASVNLATGGYAHQINFRPSFGGVSNLVLKANGSIAWIGYQVLNLDSTDPVTVRLADTRGVRVPKNGYHIKARSLHLTGSRLTWKKGRKTYSTTLH
ncbi:MAG: hypothetical protein M3065_10635 [Actinomycetota bacterium]|nr:hypothetical protein [Actinomycetota bacterium]